MGIYSYILLILFKLVFDLGCEMGIRKGKFIHGGRVIEETPPPDYTPGAGETPTGSVDITVFGTDTSMFLVGNPVIFISTGSDATVVPTRVTGLGRVGSVSTFAGNPGDTFTLGFDVTASVGYLTASVFNSATKLAFTTQPDSLSPSDAVLIPQPTITIEDTLGNIVLTNSSSVAISLLTISGTGTLLGTTTKVALSGSAPFANLKISGSGTFKMVASASGLTPTTSSLITIASATNTGSFLTRIISYKPVSGSLSSYSMSVFIPTNYNPAVANPTILVLGGSGQEGTDGTSQLTDGLATKVAISSSTWPTITIFPQWPQSGSNGGREWAYPMIRAAQTAVESEWNCDPTRRYLTGFSRGAMVGFEYLYQQPYYFAACLLGAGYLPSSSLAMTASIPNTSAQKSADLVASYTPFLPIRHYQSDSDGVVLPAQSDPIRIAYQTVNPYYVYVAQSGLYHTDAYMAMYNDPAAWTWLYSQSRVPVDEPERFDTYRHANDYAGNVLLCNNVTEFQNALNTCVDGDRIELVTGSIHVGQFFLRNRGTTGFVEIRTNISTAQLDAVCPQDVRMTPAKAAQLNLATIKCNQPNGGINALFGARGYRFTAINVTHNNNDVNGLMRLGDISMTQNSQISSYLGVDRCVLTGSPTFNVRRAISFTARYSFVKDSWITDFADANSDSQPVAGYGCAGPVLIQNNRMEGWSEGFIVGGANSSLGGSNILSVPSDYVIRNNTITRNLAYKGTGYPHNNQKNGSEFKSCLRGLMENNEVFYTWAEGQTGYGLNLKTDSSQDSTQVNAGSRHITVRNNYFHNIGAGMTINANPDGTPNVVLANHLYIHDNLMETANSGITLGQASTYGIGGDLRYLWIEHNTAVKFSPGGVPGINMVVYGGPYPGPLYFRSNMWFADTYGIKADAVGSGVAGLNGCFSNYTWIKNIEVNTTDPSGQPANNYVVGSEANIGYVNYAQGGLGYLISSASLYKAKGHDGFDIGVVNIPIFWNNVSKSLASSTGSIVTPPPTGSTPPPTGSTPPPTGSTPPPTGSTPPPTGSTPGPTGSYTGSFPSIGQAGPAIYAELPRSTTDVTYPTAARQIRVPAGGNLQSAINAAVSGDEILLAPGATYLGGFVLPNKGSTQGWITIRTDLTDAVIGSTGSRMTPGKAASANLAKVLTTTNNTPVFGTVNGSHNYRLVGLEISSTVTPTLMNMLVQFGDSGGNGQTMLSQVPHHLIVDRCYVHGSAALDLKRNITLNCAYGAVVDSWIAYAHSTTGDSQAVLGYNGPGPFLIQNNYMEAGHEVVMWGGSDPADATLTPQDVTLRGCHVSRPPSWKGLYQVKNLLETKNVIRYLIEGNLVEDVWTDAQAGYALVMKSENQDGTAPYTTTSDVTIRYNYFRNIASFANFSGKGSKSTPNITAARFTIYNNYVTNVNVGIYTGDGIPFQFLGMQDVAVIHNTVLNSGASNQAISFDSGPTVRLTFHSNVMYNGTYGIKGTGTQNGTNTLTTFAPGCLFENNLIVGGPTGLTPSNTIPSTMPATLPTGYDGVLVGADVVTCNLVATGSVVSPTSTGTTQPTGIAILPGQSIQSFVDANPTGTTFILKTGTHVRQTVVPKDSMTFVGEVGTIMDGQNVTQFAFKGYNGSRWINNVAIKNLAITNYAPPSQNGAIYGGDDTTNSTTAWTLDTIDVGYSGNLGVRIGNGMRVLNSKLHHCNTINIGGVGNGVLIDGVESSYGNPNLANDPGFESGGTKFVLTDSLIVRNSFFHHNGGVGLWLDISNANFILENNRVEDNVREGIVNEIGFAGIIRNNTVRRNGWPTDPYRANGWLWDAGIGIHASAGVEVYGNILDENFNGIVIIQQPRDVAHGDVYAPTGGYIAQNNYIHDNTIYQRTPAPGGDGGASGAATDIIGGDALFTSRNNRWVNNTYYLGTTNVRPFAWMNGFRTAAEWKAFGQDASGSFNP
jgi:hypothetical protein